MFSSGKVRELRFCHERCVGSSGEKISESDRQRAHEVSEQLATDGYRVLTFAMGVVAGTDLAHLPELDWVGMAGLIDPLRPEAIQAVQECKDAGISVVMVTGDHPATALFIAKELGIATEKQQVITGKDLGNTTAGDGSPIDGPYKRYPRICARNTAAKESHCREHEAAGTFYCGNW